MRMHVRAYDTSYMHTYSNIHIYIYVCTAFITRKKRRWCVWHDTAFCGFYWEIVYYLNKYMYDVRTVFWCDAARYDFGITAWSVLLIKSRGQEAVSDVYVYLSNHGEALGILVACAPIGGFLEGLIGSNALRIGRNKVQYNAFLEVVVWLIGRRWNETKPSTHIWYVMWI